MCPYFIKKDIIDPWMQFFIDILDLPLPESLVTLTNDADEIVHRNDNILWKMKGIAGEITQKIFRRYRDPREFENLSNNQNFSKHLIDKWSVPLMNSQLQIFLAKKTNFVGNKSLINAIAFLGQSTLVEETMEQLKPYCKDILCNLIVPILKMTSKDIDMFQNNPVEYIAI